MKSNTAVILFAASTLLAHAATIDRMSLLNYYAPYSGYAQNKLWLPSIAQTYYLNDGTSWGGGAGTTSLIGAAYQGATESDGYIYYDFAPLYNGVLFQNTDYDGGNHSAQGTLGWTGDVIVVAQAGSTVAEFSGGTEILDNTETWYGQPRFNYYSASVGQSVYFEMDFVLYNSTWQLNTFDTSPTISGTGYVDFTNPVPEPREFVFLCVTAISVWIAGGRTRLNLATTRVDK
jgi:hypothetical protein